MPRTPDPSQPAGWQRLRDLPHHRSRIAVWLLDAVFHLIGWIWGTVIVGGLVVNVLLSYAQYGAPGLSDPNKYVLIALVLAHPGVSIAAAAVLLLLTLFGAIAHFTVAHPAPTPAPIPAAPQDTLSTTPVSQLDLRDIRFKLGPDPSPAYFERPAFAQAYELLRKAAVGSPQDRFGLVIFGVPMVGKSRMALECLRRAAPQFELLIWPHLWPGRDTTALLASLDRFKDRPIALLLDDLQEYARQNEATFVLAAIERLRALCRPLVVVATSRTGADQDAVERDFGLLLEHTYQIALAPMDPAGAEAQSFLREMAEEGATLHTQSFDGTPGSALLDLDRRTELLRARSFPQDALAILQALALLRRAQTYTYPESRVRRVAQEVFGLSDGAAWTRALDDLLTDGWLRLDPASGAGESGLRLPTDAYLDTCLAARYPLPGRRIEDDFPALLRALANAPADANALFALAEALREDPLGDKAAQGELALQAVTTGLDALELSRDRELWASGQAALGMAYANRILGERADNLERAISAYKAALTVYTRGASPANWATTQTALGTAYAERIRGEQADNLERALAAYEQALTVYTREAFPVDWATTQNNLGIAFLVRIRGEREDNLERAIAAVKAALTIFTREAFPVQWALTTYNMALLRADQSKEASQRGDAAGCRAHQAAALAGMRSTLDVYTADGFPDNHADVLGQIARIEAMGCEPAAADGAVDPAE